MPYICHTECYAKDNVHYRVGDVFKGEGDPGKHFSLAGEEEAKAPEPKPGTTDGINEAVEELRKANKISVARADAIYKDAKAKEPHERLKALTDFVKTTKKE